MAGEVGSPRDAWVQEGARSREHGQSIALDLESIAYGKGRHVAGVSYDFKKAFDLIPTRIMLRLLRERGLHSRILLPKRNLYDCMERVFKLGGVVGDWFWAYNGILQGDALSMSALNSTVSCIIEAASAFSGDNTRERSYADDINALTVADTRDWLS